MGGAADGHRAVARVTPEGGEIARVEPVGLIALGHREQTSAVPDDVDVRELAHGAGEVGPDLGRRRRVAVRDAGPDRVARRLFGHHHRGPDEPVGVARGTLAELDPVHHRVAVERVEVAPGRVEPGVGSVAQVGAMQPAGDLPRHRRPRDVDLGALWRENTPEVGLVGGVDSRGTRRDVRGRRHATVRSGRFAVTLSG